MKKIAAILLILIFLTSSISTAVCSADPNNDYTIYQNDKLKLTIYFSNGKLTRNKNGDIKTFEISYKPFSKYDIMHGDVMFQPYQKFVSPNSKLVLFFDNAGASYVYNVEKDIIATIPFKYASVIWNKEGNDVLFASHLDFWRQSMDSSCSAPLGLWVNTGNRSFKQLIKEDKFADYRCTIGDEVHFLIRDKLEYIFYRNYKQPLEFVYNVKTGITKYITYIPENCNVVTKEFNGKGSLTLTKNSSFKPEDKDSLTIYKLKSGYKLCFLKGGRSWIEKPDTTTLALFLSDCVVVNDYIYFADKGAENSFDDFREKFNLIKMKYDGSSKTTIIPDIAAENMYYSDNKLYLTIREKNSKGEAVKNLYSCDLNGKNLTRVYKQTIIKRILEQIQSILQFGNSHAK